MQIKEHVDLGLDMTIWESIAQQMTHTIYIDHFMRVQSRHEVFRLKESIMVGLENYAD